MMEKSNKNLKKRVVFSTAGAAVAGAVVGVTAGAVLANKNTRKKVFGAINQIKGKANGAINHMENAPPNARKKIARIASKTARKVKVN